LFAPSIWSGLACLLKPKPCAGVCQTLCTARTRWGKTIRTVWGILPLRSTRPWQQRVGAAAAQKTDARHLGARSLRSLPLAWRCRRRAVVTGRKPAGATIMCTYLILTYSTGYTYNLPGADRLEPPDELWWIRPSDFIAAFYPPPRKQHGHGRQRLLRSS